MKDKTLYDKDSIQSLSPLEHVRLRPGVYVGDTATPTQLVVEIFSNALDEHNLGHGNEITVSIDTASGETSVIDNGQGFPVKEKREDGKTVLQASFDEMNTSGKYSDDGVYQGVAVGLNGQGGKCANFLSHSFLITTYRDGKFESIVFEEGVFKKRTSGKATHSSGTEITFTPSEEFFSSPISDVAFLRKLFNDTCAICPNLVIHFAVDGKIEDISHPEGMEYFIDNGKSIIDRPLIFQEQQDKYVLSCAMTYTDNSAAKIIAYVNHGLTEQGPHISAIKTNLTRTMNKWARENNILKQKEKNLDGDSLQEGVIIAFNLVSPGVKYDAQVKSRIVSNNFVPFINEVFSKRLEIWLDNNPDDGRKIIEKALLARRAAEAARKAREAVRQKAEKKDKIFKLPTKLTDCWSKDRSKCELLIAEGDSAKSGLVAGRSSEFQAVYGVRGKILNVLKTTPTSVMKNQEINNLVVALGLDYNPQTGKMIYDEKKLRYSKIIACADADFDGFMIENLLFNALWYLCPELIINGHVYSAVPPLYKITTKKNEYVYLRDDKALQEYKKKHKDIQSINRLKGLGEQDSDELAECLLDPETRHIVQLTVSDIERTDKLFTQLYGKAVEPRVKFILDHSEEARID